MKKITLLFAICLGSAFLAKAQVIPSAQFGVKAGANLTSFSTNNTFSSDKRAGYLVGFYARFGGLGFNFQPELYVTSKNLSIAGNDGSVTKAKFTSIDVPLLVGTKIGAFGLGGRFYAGPLASFSINKDQSFFSAAGDAARLKYKDANIAAVIGAGLDVKDFSVDLRYERGLTKQSYNNGNSDIKVNLFTLSVAYKLFSL